MFTVACNSAVFTYVRSCARLPQACTALLFCIEVIRHFIPFYGKLQVAVCKQTSAAVYEGTPALVFVFVCMYVGVCVFGVSDLAFYFARRSARPIIQLEVKGESTVVWVFSLQLNSRPDHRSLNPLLLLLPAQLPPTTPQLPQLLLLCLPSGKITEQRISEVNR